MGTAFSSQPWSVVSQISGEKCLHQRWRNNFNCQVNCLWNCKWVFNTTLSIYIYIYIYMTRIWPGRGITIPINYTHGRISLEPVKSEIRNQAGDSQAWNTWCTSWNLGFSWFLWLSILIFLAKLYKTIQNQHETVTKLKINNTAVPMTF